MEDLSFQDALLDWYVRQLAEEIHNSLVREGKIIVAEDGDTILYYEDDAGNVVCDFRHLGGQISKF